MGIKPSNRLWILRLGYTNCCIDNTANKRRKQAEIHGGSKGLQIHVSLPMDVVQAAITHMRFMGVCLLLAMQRISMLLHVVIIIHHKVALTLLSLRRWLRKIHEQRYMVVLYVGRGIIRPSVDVTTQQNIVYTQISGDPKMVTAHLVSSSIGYNCEGDFLHSPPLSWAFQQYFSCTCPLMNWWDTGVGAQVAVTEGAQWLLCHIRYQYYKKHMLDGGPYCRSCIGALVGLFSFPYQIQRSMYWFVAWVLQKRSQQTMDYIKSSGRIQQLLQLFFQVCRHNQKGLIPLLNLPPPSSLQTIFPRPTLFSPFLILPFI